MSWSSRQERPRLGAAEGGSSAPERYEILGELGQGGMSVVFRARDKQLGRDVAVKVLHDFLARQPDARKRFHREAVAVARLRHPGIVEIHDYSGPDAEDAYIVCELIEGHTLRALVDEHGVPPHPELAVLVIAELVRALRHAHEQGIVHRDVKPENVMITPSGLLKLMDFGIAQIMEGATKLTATGTLLGSPAHMAPEVIDGKPSDHRSDIFSVGTMLYWLATGELPFQAPNPSALFRRILEGTYEPCQMLNPKIGNGLARVIDHALAADPEARYQDVSELQADLQKELEEVGLVPADSLVKRYLADPRGFAEQVRPKIVEALVAKGNQALEAGNVARAMDRFNRVLAIDPEHPEVARRVSLIGRRERFNRRARRAAVALAVAAGVAGVAGAGVAYWPEAHEAPAPVATKP
ncbi:MAG: serine/threonine protein kinase, partial [Myxococcales bacterium]|nr:serine/threonine protein kinase [Myxococcales bacterium]